jgi:tripartite-type tricarboxylate transporter receptor subunit TctC
MVLDRRSALGVLATAAIVPLRVAAQGQALRIVVPFSAGSGTDAAARVLGEAITTISGQTVIVDNKGGGGGVLGAAEVARARPDGSTVLYTTGGFTTNAVLIRKAPYDSIADFTPIVRLSRSSGFALLVPAKSPYKTLDQYIAAARAKPSALTFGSSGVGNTTHVMGVLFSRGVGVELVHVPFRGTPTTDLIAGTVDSAFLSPSVAAPQIRAGQLRALGISGTTRSPLLPDVPTFAEAGLKVQDIPAWSGVWGPAKMPPAVVQSLYDTMAKASRTPAMLKYNQDTGSEPDAMPPDAFKAYVTSEIERYKKLLPPLGIEIS